MSETGTRVPPLWDHTDDVVEYLTAADGLALYTDFDGTIAPITEEPDDAKITPANRTALDELREHPQVRIGVVSGRQLRDVRSRVDIDGVDYAGNHGLELGRDGETVVHPVADRRRPTIQQLCDRLDDALAGSDGAFVENKNVTATVHYRQTPDDRVETVRSAVADAIETVGDERVRTTEGKQIVEIRPDVEWHKGDAVSLLDEERGAGWVAIYLGDDTTDESAFRALGPDGIGIHVGTDPPPAATFRVDDPDAVAAVFDWLLDTGVERLS